MKTFFGQSNTPLLLLHGGAGPMDPSAASQKEATSDLLKIAESCLAAIAHSPPLEAVAQALRGLEDNPRFNAGTGSALQADGAARLTAAVMDGQRQSFSGVVGVSYLRHPSRIAYHLQDASSRVVTEPGASLKARQLGLPIDDVLTPKRVAQWMEQSAGPLRSMDTVGALACNDKGDMAAGTSTGGRGLEFPGRMSDSGTVAGNYASKWAAISATGIGEEIVDDALCARIETRVRDGAALQLACEKTLAEAVARKRSYGWIALAQGGQWAVCHTTPAMSFVLLDASGKLIASS